MELALLIDFGSTFTKVTAVDLAAETVVATARAFSTVETDIMEGLLAAVTALERQMADVRPRYRHKIACSSAAGGLKMVAVGLVPELTAEAAKRAALGAGARVLEVYTHELTSAEMGKIESQKPDIILLAGGTDGGNRDVILHNARQLAAAPVTAPVVAAGNKSAADEVAGILQQAGKPVIITENVMPELNRLNVEPARAAIREVFLDRIVLAKGLHKAETYIDRVLMPTPAAVLNAARLLADGRPEEPGLGELVVVDIGGATTDIHSIAKGYPTKAGVALKGLPEPLAKRTVEGDLGMRYSAVALYEAAGEYKLKLNSGFSDGEMENGKDLKGYVDFLAAHPGHVPANDLEQRIDTGLGYTAAELAMERHAGRVETVYTPAGASYVQYGKDLTEVKYLIGTGGVITDHPAPAEILRGALRDPAQPVVLKPRQPVMMVDKRYILAAMGLLAELFPVKALRMMKKYLQEI
ncbi:MAG: methylaspartate mutase accessory protein GlmL [Bacillota bacterium]